MTKASLDLYKQAPEAIFLDVAMGGMNPKRESKREWFMSTYLYMFVIYKYRYIYIVYNKRDSKLSFRLPFVGHDIPWIRPKIGPLVMTSLYGHVWSRECFRSWLHYRHGSARYWLMQIMASFGMVDQIAGFSVSWMIKLRGWLRSWLPQVMAFFGMTDHGSGPFRSWLPKAWLLYLLAASSI